MSVLKTSDILAKVDERPTEPAPKASNPPKPRAQRAPKDLDERKRQAAETANAKPSPYASDLRHKLRQKVQLSFGQIPEFISDELSRLSNEAGMNKREYLYHLLRDAGADIPPYDQLDGRKL